MQSNGDPSRQAAAGAELNFEQAMDQLEAIVTELERGDVPLEKSIDLFQRGMQLSQLCGQKLEQVERKIETIVEEDGQLRRRNFAGEAEGGDSF
ncbi:exodeoxyribonuclease VII small subunit [Saccharibacillus alkalitolerans]|uniref:Exodeoxyribonuclease 7 small subunit n=1 Tax=Saccharibacillus alkalitolerans TaxID=2705290 RepID=A0ABX0F3I8_9BACL|nr:exodeoxyribonuclease VII small subunit [Saccharibacillus alkalitolerans]NGZ74174.1 exodeoxyribonuclease VII small subunit [Saccharibacillus alkalitolerans]